MTRLEPASVPTKADGFCGAPNLRFQVKVEVASSLRQEKMETYPNRYVSIHMERVTRLEPASVPTKADGFCGAPNLRFQVKVEVASSLRQEKMEIYPDRHISIVWSE